MSGVTQRSFSYNNRKNGMTKIITDELEHETKDSSFKAAYIATKEEERQASERIHLKS
jgi:hypothetical protein